MPEPTYRLINSGVTLTEVDAQGPTRAERAPAPRPVPPVQTKALDVQAHAEHELEAIVDEERRDRHNEDLLNRDAQTE